MHAADLTKLAETDPEFYKYLQENDKELLDFDPEEEEEVDDMEEDVGSSKGKIVVLTNEELSKWQRAILEACAIIANNACK